MYEKLGFYFVCILYRSLRIMHVFSLVFLCCFNSTETPGICKKLTKVSYDLIINDCL